MMKKHQIHLAVLISLIPIHSSAASYAGWLTQIGETDAVMSASSGGKGITIGIVDTGVSASNFSFAKGQVKGSNDVQNHGTAVAEIAAGNTPSRMTVNFGGYATQTGYQLSVAPNANIYAYQALGPNGSGSTLSVANGIIAVANSGVSVINLSLGFSSAPDANIINAMNYAASKGAIIVWAGGNNSSAYLNGANMNGLSAKTISQTLFVGSVNASDAKSSFSNTPGKGTMNGVSYASRWITAPGENILAPYNIASMPNFATYVIWTGTSMSAPMVSGSIALLDSTWKVLQTQGTSANLLLATSKNGELNLTNAFAPIGSMGVMQANGTMIPQSNLTGAMLNNGVLGNLSAIKSLLSNYTAFDSFNRNYSVNLSGLVNTSSANSAATASSGSVAKMATITKYANSFAHDDSDTRLFVSNGENFYNQNVVFFKDENTFLRQSYLNENSDTFSLTDTQTARTVAMGGKLDPDTRYKIAVRNNLNSTASEIGFNHNFDDALSASVTLQNLNENGMFLGNTFGGLFNVNKTNSQGIQTSLSYKLNDQSGLSIQHDRVWSSGNNTNSISESLGVSFNVESLVLGIKQPLHVVAGSMSVPLGYADSNTGLPSVMLQSVSLKPTAYETDFHIAYTTELFKEQSLGVRVDFMQNYMNTANYNNSSIGLAWTQRF
jgi:Subtilase family